MASLPFQIRRRCADSVSVRVRPLNDREREAGAAAWAVSNGRISQVRPPLIAFF